MAELNEAAGRVVNQLVDAACRMRVTVEQVEGGGRLIDCGVDAEGGLDAGRLLARACLAGRGDVSLPPGPFGPAVQVATDDPVGACMASQYAGWQVACELPDGGSFFGMGSGPMRAAAATEALFEDIGRRERPSHVVGVLETAQQPSAAVYELIAEQCHVPPHEVSLLVAKTASLAGTLQVVARSVETALHKLHELGFDLSQVVSGWGVAPLPPVAANDLAAIGWTNDAVLYGGQVVLWVRADEDALETIAPQVPSSASSDYGRPFGEIFRQYDGDFYKIDPHLFSPAEVTFHNLETGRTRRCGQVDYDLLRRSFEA